MRDSDDQAEPFVDFRRGDCTQVRQIFARELGLSSSGQTHEDEGRRRRRRRTLFVFFLSASLRASPFPSLLSTPARLAPLAVSPSNTRALLALLVVV